MAERITESNGEMMESKETTNGGDKIHEYALASNASPLLQYIMT